MIEVKCPACRQTTTLHTESVAVGVEIMCRECGAILAVEKVNPVVLAEIELEDDS